MVELSSRGHRFSDVDLDDPGFERTPYDPWVAYGRSKTANVLFAVGFDQRFRDQGVRAFAVHPGSIQTELGRHLTEESMTTMLNSLPKGQPLEWKSIPQGAATSVWAATSADLDGKGGLYLEDCGIAETVEGQVVVSGVQSYALDPARPTRCGRCPNRWLAWHEGVRDRPESRRVPLRWESCRTRFVLMEWDRDLG